MAINLVHRPDLDDRVEKLAARFGAEGAGPEDRYHREGAGGA